MSTPGDAAVAALRAAVVWPSKTDAGEAAVAVAVADAAAAERVGADDTGSVEAAVEVVAAAEGADAGDTGSAEAAVVAAAAAAVAVPAGGLEQYTSCCRWLQRWRRRQKMGRRNMASDRSMLPVMRLG